MTPPIIQPARLNIVQNPLQAQIPVPDPIPIPVPIPVQIPAPNPAPIPNPAPRFVIDRNISFEDRGKIPQIVRDLPDFTGNPRDLSQWILDVEDVLELFEDLKSNFQYHLLIKTIRRKIKGEANDALITSNTPTQWDSIKDVLKLYYADKRDLMTLDNQLKSLRRSKAESLESYYSRVRELVTLISSAVAMDNQWQGFETVLMRLYNQIALDTFIRGLGDPLSRFCKNFRPTSLAQAYSYCVDYLNLDARNAPVNVPSWHPLPSSAPPLPKPNFVERPPVPPRQYNAHNNLHRAPPITPRNIQQNNSHAQQNNFNYRAPPIAPPRNFHQFNSHAKPNVFAPNRTFIQPQPRPEPMDTSSIHTHHVNYGNRPIAQRRIASDSMRAHDPGAKRAAHTLEHVLDPSEYQKWYEEQLELSREFFHEEELLEPLENLNIDNIAANEETPSEETNQAQESNFLENDTEWVSKWFE